MVGRQQAGSKRREVLEGFGSLAPDGKSIIVHASQVTTRLAQRPANAGEGAALIGSAVETLRTTVGFCFVPAASRVAPRSSLRPSHRSLANLVKRFDYRDAGGKLRQEDFCQLAEKSPKEKCECSAGSSRPSRSSRSRGDPSRPVVGWTGYGDMHVKTLSLLATPNGLLRLSPAYDLFRTQFVSSLSLQLGVTGECAPGSCR